MKLTATHIHTHSSQSVKSKPMKSEKELWNRRRDTKKQTAKKMLNKNTDLSNISGSYKNKSKYLLHKLTEHYIRNTCISAQLSNQPIMCQQCNTKLYNYQLQVMFKSTIIMGGGGGGGDLSDSDCGMMVVGRWTGLSISITADILHFSQKTVPSVYSEWCNKKNHLSRSSVDRNSLLKNEVNGECPIWFELTEWLQQLR